MSRFGLTESGYFQGEIDPSFYTNDAWRGDDRPPQHRLVPVEGELTDCPNPSSVNFSTAMNDLLRYKEACWTQLNNRNRLRLRKIRGNPSIRYYIYEDKMNSETWNMFTDKIYSEYRGDWYIRVREGSQEDPLHYANGFTSAISKYNKIMYLLERPFRVFTKNLPTRPSGYNLSGLYRSIEDAITYITIQNDGIFYIYEYENEKYQVVVQGGELGIRELVDGVWRYIPEMMEY